MEAIQRSQAIVVRQAPSLPRERLFTGRTSDDRLWAVKSPNWLGYPAELFSIRLGTEMFYYGIAKHNKLPMPVSGILLVNGMYCWATEFIEGRGALGTENKRLPDLVEREIRNLLESDASQLESYIRVLFLDVMLRAFDRKVGNVLVSEAQGRVFLEYFDHEQSLGWRNNTRAFGRNRIKSPSSEYADIDGNVSLERDYRWAWTISTFAERKRIFESLDLRLSMLDELFAQIPDECWMYEDHFTDVKKGLGAWWEFLSRIPYADLDHRIFGTQTTGS